MSATNYSIQKYGPIHHLIKNGLSNQPVAVIVDEEQFQEYLDLMIHPDLTKLQERILHLEMRVLEEHEISAQYEKGISQSRPPVA